MSDGSPPERSHIITLTTDFGQADGYVGTMKGVILARCPQAQLVDLSHAIAPQDVAGAAFVLYRAYPYFPPGTIHLAVVDPGVGSARRALLLDTMQGRFVGPDNGLFTYVLYDAVAQATDGLPIGPEAVPPPWNPVFELTTALHTADSARLPRAYTLTNPAYWRESHSATFHGRDVFAPVVAHLAAGLASEQVGPAVPLADLVRLPDVTPIIQAGTIQGRVIAGDHFGNLITNVAAGLLPPRAAWAQIEIEIGPHHLRGLHPTYAAVTPGMPLALVNSAGLLEIAVRDGHAAQQLGVGVGTAVFCHPPATAQAIALHEQE